MTPETYLRRIGALTRAGAFADVMDFARANLTEALLDEMTSAQRRRAASVTHVAADALGEGAWGPPTGIPVDDAEPAAPERFGEAAPPTRTAV